MSDYLEMTIASDLFDDYPIHNVLVLHDITIQDLIAEIRTEFGFDEGEYALALKGTRKELKPDATFDELSLGNGTDLVFGRRQRKQQQFKGTQLRPQNRAYLVEEASGTRYEISRSNALIGRALSDATTSVEINLALVDKSNSVSRQHARIIEANGNYLLEALREDNPTYLNDKLLQKSEPVPIKTGDIIKVGRIILQFHAPN
ncbi:MAG: FHA domain-containing protein [bacterium]|nr:FHA domain-containing protein [bacterium]